MKNITFTFTKFLILSREQLFSEIEMAMVGGSLKSGVPINMKEPKQEGIKGGTGLQERAEKMVKGSLGSILLPGAGAGGGGAGLGGGEEGGVKRSEKPQQQRQQQTGNTGTKAPRQQQQQQQMANKPLRPVVPPQLKPAVAPKSFPGAESVEARVTSGAELNGVLSGAKLNGALSGSELHRSLSGAELNRALSGAELNGGRVLSGAELAMEKRRKMLEGLLSWHSPDIFC